MDPKPPLLPIAIKVKTEQEQSGVKIELTVEEKRIAQLLENLPLLDRRGKMELILVWRKLKSASQLYINPTASPGEVQNLSHSIEESGLLFKETDLIERVKYANDFRKVCFVASTQSDLDIISKLWSGDHVKDPAVYMEIGRMSGFPQTAIDVFDKFARFDGEERDNAIESLTLSIAEKRKLIPPDLLPFSLYFYMSKEHWQSELETVKKWAEEIKLLAPVLYNAYIATFRNIK